MGKRKKSSEIKDKHQSDDVETSSCSKNICSKINVRSSDELWEDDISDDSFDQYDTDDSDNDDNSEELLSKKKMAFYKNIGLSNDEVVKLKVEDLTVSQKEVKRPVSCHHNNIGKKNYPPPEVIVFQDPASRHKAKAETDSKRSKKDNSGGVKNVDPTLSQMDLKTTMQEVHRFGIKGMEGSDKEAAMLDLLINLGAKAPKNKYVNYKEYLEQKCAEKKRLQELKSNRLFMDDGKIRALQSFTTYQKKLKRLSRDIGPVDGRHVSGHGVKVKSKDAQRMNYKSIEKGSKGKKKARNG